MVGTRIRFTSELAPCGKTVDGEHYRDEDDEGLVISDQYFACGCRTDPPRVSTTAASSRKPSGTTERS